MKRGKKGQVTLFIILGIVIVIVIGALFALRGLAVSSRLYNERGESVSVPVQLAPVTDVISDCIENTALEALNLMGLQGGYINIPQDILARSTLNIFSNSLYVNKGLQVPYWSYESISGVQKENVPTQTQMQDELSSYINDNLQSCFSLDIEAFEDQGYEIATQDDISATSNIKDDYVEVRVEYPVDIKLKDVQKKVQTHYRKIDTNYGKLYKLALGILKEENTGYFLENKTLDVMYVYDDIPTSGGSLDCTPRVWTKQQIQDSLKNYLVDNVAAIDIEGTKDAFSEKYFLVRSTEAYPQASVDFVFSSSYPFEMKINGGEEIVSEESVSGRTSATSLLLGVFCLNNYNFIYDIKYPVLVVLSDDSSRNPAIFEFANQVIIKNNQPKQNRLYVSENILPDTQRICRYTSTNATIYAIDQSTGELVSDAKISFNCVGATCDLGSTKTDSVGEVSLFAGLAPCYNGEMVAYHKDYALAKTRVDTNRQVDTVTLLLKPKHVIDVEVKVIDNGVIRELAPDESYVIEFDSQSDEFTSLVSDERIELVSGDYYVKGYLIKNTTQEFRTGSQKIEYCNDIPKGGLLGVIGIKEKKCFSTQIDSTNLEEIITGGEEFAYSVDGQTLSKAKKITIYLVLIQEPKSIVELKDTFLKIQTNSQQASFRLPVLT